jgi:NAD(P)-dependent dehydrogenase (short-subunit alcohol dehydrogenase family)
MREFTGKTAFVTGGASGIGFALGRAFAEAGMKVMLADIETDALSATVKSLKNFGPDVRGVTCDVADPASVERAAKASYEGYGPTNTPDPASRAGALAVHLAELAQSGLDPSDVAAQVLAAIREDELYVFTHPQMHDEVKERFAAILAAMDKAAAR